MKNAKFKMLYDGLCPFCLREMQWLQKRDQQRQQMLEFEDISHPDFKPERYQLTREAVHHYLHGILPDGSVIKGLEVTRYTLRAVGFGWIARVTELPILRSCCEWGYDWFARYRVPLGRFFGKRCLPCEIRPAK